MSPLAVALSAFAIYVVVVVATLRVMHRGRRDEELRQRDTRKWLGLRDRRRRRNP